MIKGVNVDLNMSLSNFIYEDLGRIQEVNF